MGPCLGLAFTLLGALLSYTPNDFWHPTSIRFYSTVPGVYAAFEYERWLQHACPKDPWKLSSKLRSHSFGSLVVGLCFKHVALGFISEMLGLGFSSHRIALAPKPVFSCFIKR